MKKSKIAPKVRTFPFLALPLELQLLIAEQLECKSLLRLQRVSKSMRDLVAHTALDRAMFRAAYDKKALLSAPCLKLHPILQRLPSYNFEVCQSLKDIFPHIRQQILQENATNPPCSLIYFNSYIEHECTGPEVDTRGDHDVADWDKCIVNHEVNGHGSPVTVEEFLQGFLSSCDCCCSGYIAMEESFEDSGNLLVFRGWDVQRIDRETCSGWYEEPIWEPLPHDPVDCGVDECRQCREMEWEARWRSDSDDDRENDSELEDSNAEDEEAEDSEEEEGSEDES